MAQLWGGRFTKETDKLVYNFNASISFDQKFFAQDVEGSIAHAVMLEKQGIISLEEKTFSSTHKFIPFKKAIRFWWVEPSITDALSE